MRLVPEPERADGAMLAALALDRTDAALALLVFVVALAARAAMLWATAFDGLYGQDAFAYFDYAVALLRALRAGEAPPPFHWPIGYPLLAAAAMAAAGVTPWAAQLVSMLAGALVAPLVYALVRELGGERAGALVAGLLAAVSAQLMISSLSVMADAAGLFWITLSAWLLVRHQHLLAGRRMTGRAAAALIAAAVVFALAVITRWPYGLAALPCAVATLLAWQARGLSPRQRVLAGAAALAVIALVIGAQFAADLERESASYVGNFRMVSWSPLNAVRRTLVNADGVLRYERPVALFYAVPLVHPSYVIPLVLPFLVVGATALWRRGLAAAVLVIGWIAAMYLFLAGLAWENWRFALMFFPPLLVLVGLGFGRAVRSRYRRLVIAGAALAVLGSAGWMVRDVRAFVEVKTRHLEIVRWAERTTPEDAAIVSFGLTQMLQHYTQRPVTNLYEVGPDELAALAAGSEPIYLLVDPDNLEAQWRDKTPERNLDWLRRHATLIEVGRRPPWVLLAVDGAQPAAR